MDRRRFLAAVAALPFAPEALRRLADEPAGAAPAPGKSPAPPAGLPVLAAAVGEPLSVTVVVPPDRVLRLCASVTMAAPGTLWLVEATGPRTVALAGHAQLEPGHVELVALVRPTAGAHTYRLAGAPVRDGALAAIDVL